MGRSTKRKHNHYTSQPSSRHNGLRDQTSQSKRPRVSPDPPDPPDGHSSKTDGGEWQVVGPRKDRNRREQHRESTECDGSIPRLKHFGDPYAVGRQPIRMSDLRDLALYVLAEGVGPNWIAVMGKRGIQRVVMVMVPGLDGAMMDRARFLLSKESKEKELGQQNNAESKQDTEQGVDSKLDSVSNPTSEAGSPPNDDDLSLQQVQWLLDSLIPVKAPGDPKYARISSPLQAILMKPLDDPVVKAEHGKRDPGFKSIPTQITQFLHTADELRDSEYPIHPATFTSQPDATLEAERRDSARQDSSNGWVDAEVSVNSPVIPPDTPTRIVDSISQGLTVYALDCEMVMTSDGKSSLARVSIVSWPHGQAVLDRYVKPSLPITNYFTQYSGITPEILENVTTRLQDVQIVIKKLLTPSTILLGHSLESDLNALQMTHPFIIDTSLLYPHPRGLPLRSSLKFLANKYLKREIQTAGASGHNSVEDAKAVLDLVRLKCEKGPKFGTSEANGENIFKYLAAYGSKPGGRVLTSAIVEYGTPEKGFGKDAIVAIGCQNDDEVVQGVIRAVTGVASTAIPGDGHDGPEVLPAGANFTWSRLRALEYARNWVSNPSTASDTTGTAASTTKEHAPASAPDPDVDSTLKSTLSNLTKIRDALSSSTSTPSTLLIICSGTSDVRPLMALQNQQQQYRKEFKVKKWDELSVQWTDREEQALRHAFEEARKGWGWVGVV